MYIPRHFAETDAARLHDFIERYSFGLLVGDVDGHPFASHLPFLLERDVGPHGRLVGHMARANPQWRGADGREVLVVFSGPHAYVSPSWYGAEAVVPTWNYAAVHAYGTFRAVEEPVAVKAIVAATVRHYEGSRPAPWELDATADYVDRLTRHIVGFHIEVARLEGKWKMSQNHPAERRRKVIRALEARGDENGRDVAAIMRDLVGD